MSQQKVDRYKEQKANRKQILKHEKRMHRLEMTGLAIGAAAVICWFGFSVYQDLNRNDTKPAQKTVTELEVGGIREYMETLQQDTQE